jgi:hypothetical protein
MTDIHVTFTSIEASAACSALLRHCECLVDASHLSNISDETRQTLQDYLDQTKDALAAIRNAQQAAPLASRRVI